MNSSSRHGSTPEKCTFGTPEACWDNSQGYASFAYRWKESGSRFAPWTGCEESSIPLRGAVLRVGRIPARLQRARSLISNFTKTPFAILAVLGAVFCAAAHAEAQLPSSPSGPILGYVFDVNDSSIKPIAGIIGNSYIGQQVELGFSLTQAAILSGQASAIAGSDSSANAIVISLETRPVSVQAITGAPSNPSAISISSAGSAAVLYYAGAGRMLVVRGLPQNPTVTAAIDLSSVQDPLTRMAVNDEGTSALLGFSQEDQDALYAWTAGGGLRFITAASKIGAITFVGAGAIVADKGTHEAFLINDVGGGAARGSLTGPTEELSEPVAIAVSSRQEIYIGNAGTGTVVTFDLNGRALRTQSCSCAITDLYPIRDSVFRLTSRLDQTIFLLDAEDADDRIVFVPAIPKP